MKVLSLDPGTNCGFAFYNGSSIEEAGCKTFPKTEIEGERLHKAYSWLKETIDTWKPDIIVAESYFASSRFANGSNLNFEIRGSFKMGASQRGVPYIVASPSEWKKSLCGRTTPTKNEKKKWGKAKCRKMMTVARLTELGFTFPKKEFNTISGREINFRFDASDAIGILVFYLDKNSIKYTISENLFTHD